MSEQRSWHPDRATGWRLLLVNIGLAPVAAALILASVLVAEVILMRAPTP